MEAKEQILQAMREAGQPLNAGKVALSHDGGQWQTHGL